MKNLFILITTCMIFILAGCQNYGKVVKYGNLEIYYKEGATEDEANKLGEYLIKNEIVKGDSAGKTIQLIKANDTVHVKIVVKPIVTFNTDAMNEMPVFAAVLSKSIFNGAPVVIDLCHEKMDVFQTIKMDDWQSYTTEAVEVKYPSSWALDKSGTNGTSFILYPTEPREGVFTDNVSLTANDATGQKVDLNDYIKKMARAVSDQAMVKDGKVLEVGDDNISNAMAKKLAYTADLGNNQRRRIEQYIWLTGDKLYALTIVANLDNLDQEFLKTSEKIARTVKGY